MSLSVIIVNRNGRDLLPDCISSIPPGVETVVVDNGSTDGSAEETVARFPFVRILRNGVNRGFAAAVNQGVAATTGRHVCLLNSDARLESSTLGTLAAHLDTHPDVAAAAPQLLHEDGRAQHSFDAIPSLASEFLNKSLLRRLFPKAYPSKRQEHHQPVDVPSVIGACMMIRRAAFDRIGGLDETYFVFLEETDWCLRAVQAGLRVVFIPTARCVHLQGRTRARAAVRARIEYVRSMFTFFRKQRPASYPFLRALYPLKNLVELVTQLPAVPFSARRRKRWVETAALLGWQACLCPPSFGLSADAGPAFLTPRPGWHVSGEHAEAMRDFTRQAESARVVKDHRHKRTVEMAAGGKTFLVKTYKKGNAWRRLKDAFGLDRPRHELRCYKELLRRGVPTAPLAAVIHRSVVVEKMEGWRQLQEVLVSDATPDHVRRDLAFRYGRFARRLHDAGVWQYDFNPTNILVRDRRFVVIDMERMDLFGRLPESVRLFSLAKMNRIPGLSRTDRLRFLRGYLDSRILEKARWKEIARSILASGADLRVRDASRARDRCLEDNRDFGVLHERDVRGYYRKHRPERPGTGISLEDLRCHLRGDSRSRRLDPKESEAALDAWCEANARAQQGRGPAPIAVILKRDEKAGTILYPVPLETPEDKT